MEYIDSCKLHIFSVIFTMVIKQVLKINTQIYNQREMACIVITK